ncbi:phage terminase large subunit [Rhizobium rhizogenes]
MAKLRDPLKDREPTESQRLANHVAQKLKEERQVAGEISARQAAIPAQRPAAAPPVAVMPGASLDQRIRADFRVFLTLVWRHTLGCDPNPIQLDLAYWLQHGPDRAIIMAFRGFSKSWITGAYALWRLYCDPDEKIMVVSGSLKRAIATSTWCFSLIMSMDILAHMRPKADTRQSATAWDIGNCIPAQSASFTPFGIGGQLVGFRGSCIIPDDVETQTNSLTVVMREKIEEAVKEFESVLVPGGVIKYLGTPHDIDSLYMKLLRLKEQDGKPVYQARIWPALFPTTEEIKKYGKLLAPYITATLNKLGPASVGHSTMPNRFTDDDLEKRRAAMGNSEFRLQFMLDLAGSLMDKFPLKLKDLMVMDLDPVRAPEELVWGINAANRDPDLPVMGFDGDYYHRPAHVGTHYSPYNRKIAFVDNSGRGDDETSMAVGGELFGRAFLLDLFATKDGYGMQTLETIASLCVRWDVSTIYVEANFGDGMFVALLRPVLAKAWEREATRRKNAGMAPLERIGTAIEEVRSGTVQKEKRMLSVLEPVTQQHRLVINREVLLYDKRSVDAMDGEDTRHRYALGYQFTHLTRDKDCLGHDDRLDSVAGMLSMLAAELGVDPEGIALRAKQERQDTLLAELEDDGWEQAGRGSGGRYGDHRVQAARISTR